MGELKMNFRIFFLTSLISLFAIGCTSSQDGNVTPLNQPSVDDDTGNNNVLSVEDLAIRTKLLSWGFTEQEIDGHISQGLSYKILDQYASRGSLPPAHPTSLYPFYTPTPTPTPDVNSPVEAVSVEYNLELEIINNYPGEEKDYSNVFIGDVVTIEITAENADQVQVLRRSTSSQTGGTPIELTLVGGKVYSFKISGTALSIYDYIVRAKNSKTGQSWVTAAEAMKFKSVSRQFVTGGGYDVFLENIYSQFFYRPFEDAGFNFWKSELETETGSTVALDRVKQVTKSIINPAAMSPADAEKINQDEPLVIMKKVYQVLVGRAVDDLEVNTLMTNSSCYDFSAEVLENVDPFVECIFANETSHSEIAIRF